MMRKIKFMISQELIDLALMFSISERSSLPEDHGDAAILLRSKPKMKYHYFYAATRGNHGSIVVEASNGSAVSRSVARASSEMKI